MQTLSLQSLAQGSSNPNNKTSLVVSLSHSYYHYIIIVLLLLLHHIINFTIVVAAALHSTQLIQGLNSPMTILKLI